MEAERRGDAECINLEIVSETPASNSLRPTVHTDARESNPPAVCTQDVMTREVTSDGSRTRRVLAAVRSPGPRQAGLAAVPCVCPSKYLVQMQLVTGSAFPECCLAWLRAPSRIYSGVQPIFQSQSGGGRSSPHGRQDETQEREGAPSFRRWPPRSKGTRAKRS